MTERTWTFERLLELRDRSRRDDAGVVLIEGSRFVIRARQLQRPILTLVTCRRLLRCPLGQKLARRHRQAGLPHLQVTQAQYHRLSTQAQPPGLLALIAAPWEPLSRLMPSGPWLALTHLRSPGNLGTLLRSGEAFGLEGLLLIGPRIDPFDPSVVRASMGSCLSLRYARAWRGDLKGWLTERRPLTIAASPEGGLSCRELPAVLARSPQRPPLLFLGDERRGLHPEDLALCELSVRIPMRREVDSLNLGVAGSLLLYALSEASPK